MSFKTHMSAGNVVPNSEHLSPGHPNRRQLANAMATPDQTLRTTSAKTFNRQDTTSVPSTPSTRPSSPIAVLPPRPFTRSSASPAYRLQGIATHMQRPPSHPDVVEYRYANPKSAQHKVGGVWVGVGTTAAPCERSHAPRCYGGGDRGEVCAVCSTLSCPSCSLQL